MRSDHEWLVLLGRQADLLAASVDYLYACRLQELDVDSALIAMRDYLERYRETLEVAPLHVVARHAFESPSGRQGR